MDYSAYSITSLGLCYEWDLISPSTLVHMNIFWPQRLLQSPISRCMNACEPINTIYHIVFVYIKTETSAFRD